MGNKDSQSALRLAPYETGHAMDMIENPKNLTYFYRKALEEFKNLGLGFTLLDGDRPVVCGGIIIVWEGVGVLWVFGKRENIYTEPILEAIKIYLSVTAESNHIHRLQVSSAEIHRNFYECLGFSCESIMQNCGPKGENYLMMRRLFDTNRGEGVQNDS